MQHHLAAILAEANRLSGYSQSELDKIALRLNQRPRKTLGFETSASKLRASVAPTWP
jgi:IS30 family transposase